MPTRDEILQALTAVIDPELRRSIVELEMVRSIDARADGTVAVTVSLTTARLPDPLATSRTPCAPRSAGSKA